MPELLSQVIQTARAAVCRRNELILENLLLRHQLQVALRLKRRLSLRLARQAFLGPRPAAPFQTGAATF